MVTGKSKTFGFLKHTVNEQFALMLSGVLEEAEILDYSVKVVRSKHGINRHTIKSCRADAL
jgi:hypothetical protein